MQQPTIEGSIKDGWWSRNRGVAESQADKRQHNNWLRRMRKRCGGGVRGMCNYNSDEAFGGDKHPSTMEERVTVMMTMLLLSPTDVQHQLTRGDGAT